MKSRTRFHRAIEPARAVTLVDPTTRDDLLASHADEISRAFRLLAVAEAYGPPLRNGGAPGAASFESALVAVLPAFGMTAEERAAHVFTTTLDATIAAVLLGLSTAELTARAGAGEAALERGSAARRAVILEDAWLSRRTLEEACSASGIEVAVSSSDPELTILAADVYRAGLALIDLEIDGNALSGEIVAMRLHENDPNRRILLVTGYEKADRIAALVPNAEALIKPVDPSLLDRSLRAAANR